MKKAVMLLTTVALIAGMTFLSSVGSSAAEVKRLTKEELKSKISSPGVIILDVRASKDWDASVLKIKGAVREDPKKSSSWIDSYPKDKTVVLYCA